MSKEEILRDLERVESQLAHLLLNWEDNFEVPDFDFIEEYTEPAIDERIIMPLDHPNSRFAYLKELGRVLIKAYKTGYLREDDLPICAPKYLEDLTW